MTAIERTWLVNDEHIWFIYLITLSDSNTRGKKKRGIDVRFEQVRTIPLRHLVREPVLPTFLDSQVLTLLASLQQLARATN